MKLRDGETIELLGKTYRRKCFDGLIACEVKWIEGRPFAACEWAKRPRVVFEEVESAAV